jgi:hypothetical protein
MPKKKSSETGSFSKINGRRLEPSPVQTPLGKPGDVCEIQYGFNPHIRKVLMRFQFSITQVVFSPEEAEHAAQQLLAQAKAARG